MRHLLKPKKNPNMQEIVANLKKVTQLKSNEPVLTPPDTYIIPANAKAIFVCAHISKEATNAKFT